MYRLSVTIIPHIKLGMFHINNNLSIFKTKKTIFCSFRKTTLSFRINKATAAVRSVWRRGLIRRISLATPDALCIWLASEKGARHCCTRDGLSGKWRVQKEKGFPNKAAASTTHPCKKNWVRLSRDYARWGGQENENKRSQFKTRLNSNLSTFIVLKETINNRT